MPLPVSLQSVVDSLSWYSEESSTYLHKPTGEIVTIDHSLMRRVEDGTLEPEEADEAADVTDQDTERDDIAHAAGILRSDEYLSFPSAYEIDEWSMMDEFTRSVVDGPLRSTLEAAIRGRGAFRRFKDVLQANGRAEAWYQFRDAAYRSIAREWLDQHHIPYLDDTHSSVAGI